MLDKNDIVDEMIDALEDMYESIVGLMDNSYIWEEGTIDQIVDEVTGTSDYVRDCVSDIDSLVKQYKNLRGKQ